MAKQKTLPTTAAYDRSFRPLNDLERRAVLSLSHRERLSDSIPTFRLDDMEVSYEFMQGGFCVCVILLYFSMKRKNSTRYIETIFRGASRRSYKDPRNTVKGEMQAFCRAMECSRGMEI